MYYMRFPQSRTKALTFSYDDGVQQDIHLASILTKAGLKGTFNINSGLYTKEGTVFEKGTVQRRMTEKEVDSLLGDGLHEVSSHSLTHPYLTRIGNSVETNEVVEDKNKLEKQFSRIVRGFAYPYGDYDEKLMTILDNAGFSYARTTKNTHSFELPERWLQWHPTCHHKDALLRQLTNQFLDMDIQRNPQLFYLWGHSYEFERDDNWNVIEDFVRQVQGHEACIWYATNIEIFDYVRDFNNLIVSSNQRIFFNPTSQSLFININQDDYEIRSNQTLVIKEA